MSTAKVNVQIAVVFDPYTRGYFAGMEAAKRCGPVSEMTRRKLRLIADDIQAVLGPEKVQ